jgi:molybdopterin molybdotransferase
MSPSAIDIRLHGFTDRASVGRATEWVDATAATLRSEEIAIGDAGGRVLADPVVAPVDVPAGDRTVADGYALRAAETVGASDYNPLPLRREDGIAILPPGAAALAPAGAPLPPGADAVMGFEATQANGATIEVFAAAANGTGIERRGEQLREGMTLLAAGRRLRPQDVGMLAGLGIVRIRVIRLPRIRLIVTGAKRLAVDQAAHDMDGPMLSALIARDGGCVEPVTLDGATRPALREAIQTAGADAILVVGRTGPGPDDEAPLALAEAGRLSLHGVALRPGGSVGMGTAGGAPAILLPGEPLACLCAYDLVAGRLVRRLAGRDPGLPYVAKTVEVGRKIVSAIGFVDLCRVRLVEGRAEPIGSAESGGLVAAMRADGFVLVPEPLEGYAPGTHVTVHFY